MSEHAAIKAELVDLSSRTEIGFDKEHPDVVRIKELAIALEGFNPTVAPSRKRDLLRGRWRMLYSSFGVERDTTLGRLTFRKFPETPIHIQHIWQEIDPDTGLYDNSIALTGPDGTVSMNVVRGRYEPHDDHRMDVVFFDTFCATDDGRSAADYAASIGLEGPDALYQEIAKTPPLHSTLTYLDDDLRLNRGSYGNLYVVQRETPLGQEVDGGWNRDRQMAV